MKQSMCVWTVVAALAAPAANAASKVESHFLPPEMPQVLFPTWVSLLPPVGSQEFSPPLVHERAGARNASAKNVSSLSDMAKEARATVELAQSSQYSQAAAAGGALLKLPSHVYSDFTWDYLANATAWSCVQMGNLKGAECAHSAAVARLTDRSLVQYHRIAADMLHETKKSAHAMKDYATYQKQMREGLMDRVKAFEEQTTLARKARSAEARLRFLKAAYDELRVLVAADPEFGNTSAKTAFREAADGLVRDAVPVMLGKARRIRDRLLVIYAQPLPEHKFNDWNAQVRALWNQVRHIKRICRMHDYLARLTLATRGEAERLFRQAHQLLFVPDDAKLVWQELGQARMLNGIAHKDLRHRVPYQETPIAPIGVAPGGPTASVGWKKVDGKMGTMDGKMQKMDGKFQKGKFQKMDGKFDKGKFQKMDGKMNAMR